MIAVILLAVCLILVGICGLFVAAEFSLLSVHRSTVDRDASRGDKDAKGVALALTTLSSQLSSAQIGITLTNLLIGFLAEPSIATLLEHPLEVAGVPAVFVPQISVVIGIVIATAVTMVGGELIPKNLAITKPLATARHTQLFHRAFTRAMKIPIKALNGTADVLLHQFGVTPREELASARSADELLSLVRRSAEKGTLSKETAVMVERSLGFSDLRALDVMTPRLCMKTVGKDESVSRIVELAKETGLSRFPVTNNHYDDVIGMVHVKQALAVAHKKRQSTKVSESMLPAVFVPSSLQLEPLLDQLKKGGMQMAIVVDEFGGTDGIVTIEDLIEELVGEVQDEHDNRRVAIRKLRSDTWLVSGLLRPDEIGEEFGDILAGR
jgi:CBS domain containing-hemolysin-like protein